VLHLFIDYTWTRLSSHKTSHISMIDLSKCIITFRKFCLNSYKMFFETQPNPFLFSLFSRKSQIVSKVMHLFIDYTWTRLSFHKTSHISMIVLSKCIITFRKFCLNSYKMFFETQPNPFLFGLCAAMTFRMQKQQHYNQTLDSQVYCFQSCCWFA